VMPIFTKQQTLSREKRDPARLFFWFFLGDWPPVKFGIAGEPDAISYSFCAAKALLGCQAIKVSQHGPLQSKIHPRLVHHWIITGPQCAMPTHFCVANAQSCVFRVTDTLGEGGVW